MPLQHQSFLLALLLSVSGCAVAVDPSELEGSDPEVQTSEQSLRIGRSGICLLTTRGPAGGEVEYAARNLRFDTQTAARDNQTVLLLGTCAEQPDKCPVEDAPVCATIGQEPAKTFASRCELRAAVLNAAGDFGSALGSVEAEGVCEPKPTPPPAPIPTICLSSADCAADEVCTAEIEGCVPAPCGPKEFCTDVCAGVCKPLPTE